MMKFAVSVFFVVGALLFSQTWEFPSYKTQKPNCNIEEHFKEIFNGQKCSNFLNFGKFNNYIYGIEVISETTVKQWKINSKEAADSEVNMQDQYVKKLIKHFLNQTDVWVVFESDNGNYLIQWNLLASSSNTNLWQLTADSASDFLFLNNTVLVIYAKSNEVFATQYKLGKQIRITEEDKRLITTEHEIQKVQLNNVEIILKDINYDVVKVHFANLFKFFNESGGAENLESKTSSMISFCIGIFGAFIFGSFIGALILYEYLKSQYKFINKPEARKQQENARSHKQKMENDNKEAEREQLNDQRNENDNEDAENTEMDIENSKHENKNGSSNQKHVATNTVENNSSIEAQTKAKNSTNKVENYGMLFNQNVEETIQGHQMLTAVKTQTSESEKPKMNLSDIELCVD